MGGNKGGANNLQTTTTTTTTSTPIKSFIYLCVIDWLMMPPMAMPSLLSSSKSNTSALSSSWSLLLSVAIANARHGMMWAQKRSNSASNEGRLSGRNCGLEKQKWNMKWHFTSQISRVINLNFIDNNFRKNPSKKHKIGHDWRKIYIYKKFQILKFTKKLKKFLNRNFVFKNFLFPFKINKHSRDSTFWHISAAQLAHPLGTFAQI